MAYNFNNTAPTTPAPESPAPTSPVSPSPMSPQPPAPATSDVPQSAALVRFRSCRWMQPPENGNTEFCTHREVKPYAGTAGFDAEAWCPDCSYYKLRRAPKKRNPADDYTY